MRVDFNIVDMIVTLEFDNQGEPLRVVEFYDSIPFLEQEMEHELMKEFLITGRHTIDIDETLLQFFAQPQEKQRDIIFKIITDELKYEKCWCNTAYSIWEANQCK